jgi:hypothetical protein
MKTRHTPEQIIARVWETEVILSEAQSITRIVRSRRITRTAAVQKRVREHGSADREAPARIDCRRPDDCFRTGSGAAHNNCRRQTGAQAHVVTALATAGDGIRTHDFPAWEFITAGL